MTAIMPGGVRVLIAYLALSILFGIICCAVAARLKSARQDGGNEGSDGDGFPVSHTKVVDHAR